MGPGWDRTRAPGSAVTLASAARHVNDWAMRPGSTLCNTYHNFTNGYPIDESIVNFMIVRMCFWHFIPILMDQSVCKTCKFWSDVWYAAYCGVCSGSMSHIHVRGVIKKVSAPYASVGIIVLKSLSVSHLIQKYWRTLGVWKSVLSCLVAYVHLKHF